MPTLDEIERILNDPVRVMSEKRKRKKESANTLPELSPEERASLAKSLGSGVISGVSKGWSKDKITRAINKYYGTYANYHDPHGYKTAALAAVVLAALVLAGLLLVASRAAGGELPDLTAHETAWSRYLADELDARDDFVLWDGREPDLVLGDRIIEIDRLAKYREGVGQALEYAAASDLKPTLILLVEDPLDDRKRLAMHRAKAAARLGGVAVWFLEMRRGKFLEGAGP